MSFYVYQLIDPRDGLPFYVGKGTGERAWAHQREVERGVGACNSRKVDRIRQILIAGHDVEVEILENYESEADALDHEWRLIDGMPALTNVVAGGGGRSLTAAQIAKRSAARKARLDAIRDREARIRAGINLDRKRRYFATHGRDEAERHQIGRWVEEHQASFSGRSSYLRPPRPANPAEARLPVIGLTEAKAHFKATGQIPKNILRGTKQRLVRWLKKQNAQAVAAPAGS